jgi:hypothetical protein
MGKGWTFLCMIQVASRSTPADSAILSATPNRPQERSNCPLALPIGYASARWGVGVNRMRVGRGIVSEAKALGKARGYADGGTATWTVKVRVAVNKL